MEILVTNKLDTTNLNKAFEPKVQIKATREEIKVLREAADICDKMRYTFDMLEIFDPHVAETAYENLLELADIIEDYKIGDKCDA